MLNRRPPSAEFWIVVLACVLWAAAAVRVYDVDLLKTHYDEYTHIISARLMVDSLTPGMSQLGFWAPLLHVVLVPMFAVPFLAPSGIAASFSLLPILCLSVVFMHRILLLCVKRPWIAHLGAVLTCLNPYILFFSVTPMAEMLLIASILGVMYYYLRWVWSGEILHLVFVGIGVSLACVSRFEGFFLVPVGTAAVAYSLWKRGYGWAKWRAYLIIFIMPALTGITFIVLYSLAYSDNFFSYATYSLGSGTSASGQVEVIPSDKWLTTLLAILYAGKHMGSWFIIIGGLAGSLLLLIFSRRRIQHFFTLSMGVAPLAFVYFTIYTGRLGLVVPELTGGYNNVRYALPLVTVCIFSLCVCWDGILQRALTWKPAAVLFSICFAVLAIAASAYHVVEESFSTPPYRPMFYERASVTLRQNLARVRGEYDFGKILTLRYRNDHTLEEFALPLSTFILEGNFRYFDQAVREPWLFARMVVFPARGRERFPAFDRLEASEEFQRFYSLVDTVDAGPDRLYVYRLNDRIFRETAVSLGYDTSLIPSLTPGAEWNPLTFYENLKGSQR